MTIGSIGSSPPITVPGMPPPSKPANPANPTGNTSEPVTTSTAMAQASSDPQRKLDTTA
jgi:hypothetical protein